MKRRMTRRDLDCYEEVVQIPYGCGENPSAFYGQHPIGFNYGVFGWNWDLWSMYIGGRRIAFISGYRVPKTRVTVELTAQEFDNIESNARKFIKAANVSGSRQDRYMAETFIENGWKAILADKGVEFE